MSFKIDAKWRIADVVRISQVIDNVISNAIKFTPEGGRVDVTVAQDEEGRVT